MVARKGFEEKMIINYIVLCADGLQLRTCRHAVQMGCKKVLQLHWSFKFVKRKDITPLSLHLFCFEEKMMHVGLRCRWVDGLYLTELDCSRLYLAS